MSSLSYIQDLPDEGQARQLLRDQVEHWVDRNLLIDKLRKMVSGDNPVAFPASAQYKAQVVHTFMLNAAINEKTSRYDSIPTLKVQAGGAESTHRTFSSNMEKAINAMWLGITRQSGNAWEQALYDVILTNGGVIRVERAPAAMWPELTVFDGKEKLRAKRPFESEDEYEKYRAEYKQCAIPARLVYVPHEVFLPSVEGGKTIVETFELEKRSIRQILANPLFDGPGKEVIRQTADRGAKANGTQKVSFMHYGNQTHHAYYVLCPTSDNSRSKWPDAIRPTDVGVGRPVLLHAYPHRLGEPLYSYIPGRFGGFLGSNSSTSESVMRAVLELNQDMDTLASQVATNLRHQGWPTLVAYYSRENRAADEGLPAPPKIAEGQSVSMWSDEKLENAMKPMDFRTAQWFMETLQDRASELLGSSALSGQRQPGVETGYHENQLIGQAEKLDKKLEDHAAEGAVDVTLKLLKHIVAMDESVPVFVEMKAKNGKEYGRYTDINPKDAEKIIHAPHMLSARVRSPRDTDVLMKLQAFMQATADRRGPGTPAMDDDTARDVILGIDSPDDVQKKIDKQSARQQLMDSGFIQSKVQKRLALLMVQEGTPQVTTDMAAGSDPALQDAIATMNAPGGEAEQMGGVAPNTAAAELEGRFINKLADRPTPGGVRPRNGMGGAMAPGAAQPAQTAGRGRQLLRGGP